MSVEAIRASIEVLAAVTRDYRRSIYDKQLLGEPGLNDEATFEYQNALIAVLLLWISQNRSLDLDNRIAVAVALANLQEALDELGFDQLPEAFVLGAGRIVPAEVPELATVISSNQQFVSGSLIPYMQEELGKGAGMTLGQLAVERQFAWETRTGLYSGAYWTAIWAGLGASLVNRLLADTQPVRRLLDPAAAHCNTCPGKAMEYGSWNEMLAFTGGLPADGSDECVSNCRCSIEIFQNGEWISAGI